MVKVGNVIKVRLVQILIFTKRNSYFSLFGLDESAALIPLEVQMSYLVKQHSA